MQAATRFVNMQITPAEIARVESQLLADLDLPTDVTYRGISIDQFSKDALMKIVASALRETAQERKYHESTLSLMR